MRKIILFVLIVFVLQGCAKKPMTDDFNYFKKHSFVEKLKLEKNYQSLAKCFLNQEDRLGVEKGVWSKEKTTFREYEDLDLIVWNRKGYDSHIAAVEFKEGEGGKSDVTIYSMSDLPWGTPYPENATPDSGWADLPSIKADIIYCANPKKESTG